MRILVVQDVWRAMEKQDKEWWAMHMEDARGKFMRDEHNNMEKQNAENKVYGQHQASLHLHDCIYKVHLHCKLHACRVAESNV